MESSDNVGSTNRPTLTAVCQLQECIRRAGHAKQFIQSEMLRSLSLGQILLHVAYSFCARKACTPAGSTSEKGNETCIKSGYSSLIDHQFSNDGIFSCGA